MADAVTSQTIVDGEKTVVQKFTNISDGTGESRIVKVDVSLCRSQLGKTCTDHRQNMVAVHWHKTRLVMLHLMLL